MFFPYCFEEKIRKYNEYDEKNVRDIILFITITFLVIAGLTLLFVLWWRGIL